MTTSAAEPTSPVRPDQQQAAPAGATGSDRFRFDIEALRAIAVGAVVLFHAGVPGFDGGYVGVDVFFVISGFLITGLMIRDKETPGGLRASQFYARRIRRLLPLATLVIVVVLAGSALFHSPVYQESVGRDAQASALFYSNIRFASEATDYFQEDAPPSPYQHFWSLSVEEQFYFVWPALFALVLIDATLAERRRRRLLVFLGALTLGSFAFCVWLTGRSQPDAFFWLPARAWELAIGALLATAAGALAGLRRPLREVLGWAGLAAIAVAVVTFDADTSFPGPWAALPVVGTAAVIVAGTGAGWSLTPLLRLAPFQWGGRYSYSLYLWHWPVLVLGAGVYETIATRWPRALGVVILGAVPLTLLSYHLLEDPVRRSAWLRDRPRVTLLLGAGLVLTSLTAVAIYLQVATTGDLTAGRPSQASEATVGPDMPVGDYVPSDVRPTLRDAIAGGTPLTDCPEELDVCVFGADDAETDVVWFGDSHSSHWNAALQAIAEEHDWRITQLAAGACPSLLYPPVGTPTVDCGAWRDEAIATIAEEQPDLVVLSNKALSGYDRDPTSFERGAREAIRRLREHAPVAIVGQTPVAADVVPDCLARHLDDASACEPKVDDERVAEVNALLARIAEEEGATFIDPAPWFCTDDRCPVITADILVYRDRSHISSDFAQTRAEALRDAMEQARGEQRS